MNRKIVISAVSISLIAALSGCAPIPLSSIASTFNGNSDQRQAGTVTPGVVVSTSPVASVGGGLFSGTRPGEDIVVRMDTNPPQMLSILQPLKSGGTAFTAGESVGVVTRGDRSHVVPLPDADTLPIGTAGTSSQALPPVTQTRLSLTPPHP